MMRRFGVIPCLGIAVAALSSSIPASANTITQNTSWTINRANTSTVYRATNTGISAVISPTGEIIARADLDERATVVATVVPETRPTTLVVAWGDWLGPVALAIGSAILAFTSTTAPRP